jgi:hypothetical protein
VDPPGSTVALTALPAQPPGVSTVSAQTPDALTALPTQAPDVVNVSGTIPAASSEGGEETDPTRLAGWSSLREVISEEGEEAADESGKGEKKEITDSSKKRRVIKTKADQEKEKIILDFAGGRGDSQTAVTSEILGTYISGPLNASRHK